MIRLGRSLSLEVLFIVAVGVVAAAVHASLQPIRLYGIEPAPGAVSGTADKPDGEATSTGIRLIGLEEARALFQAGNSAFLDAREREDYLVEHVAGALWLPFSAFARRRPAVLEYVATDGPVVVYCEGGDCHSSRMVAEMLRDFGYGDVRVLDIGWAAWKSAGHPTESGPPLVEP